MASLNVNWNLLNCLVKALVAKSETNNANLRKYKLQVYVLYLLNQNIGTLYNLHFALKVFFPFFTFK